MSITRRYTPNFAPGEASIIGMDFSYVIPPGVGIVSGSLHFFNNLSVPVAADSDFDIGTVLILGRVLYAAISGGSIGKDYQVVWTAVDTTGAIWPRTALMGCAPTS
jgi:hypothetical protein